MRASVDKEGGGSGHYEQAAEGTWCIPETKEGVGNQRKREENQDTPVRDFNSTSPAFWLRNHKAKERKLNSFQYQCLRRILRIRWQQRMTNKRVDEIAETTTLAVRYDVGGRTC